MFWRTTAVQSTERVAVEERSEEQRLSARVENSCSSERESSGQLQLTVVLDADVLHCRCFATEGVQYFISIGASLGS